MPARHCTHAEQAGLLGVDTAPAVALVRMSQVVQAAVRAELTGEMPGRAAIAAADALLQAWPEDEQPAWLARTSRLCTYSLQRTAADLLWAGGCHPVLLRAGQSLDRTRLIGPAVTYWRELAEVSDRILGRGHPDTLTARARLAEAYLVAGQVAEAVVLVPLGADRAGPRARARPPQRHHGPARPGPRADGRGGVRRGSDHTGAGGRRLRAGPRA